MFDGRLTRWWHGPFVHQTASSRGLGPGLVSIEAVREALRAAENAFAHAHATLTNPQPLITQCFIGTPFSSRAVALDDLAREGEVALGSATFVVTDPNLGTKCDISFSPQGTYVSGYGPNAVQAVDAIIAVLEHEAERTHPTFRTPQVFAFAGVASLLAVWVMAMLSSHPPLAVWLFSLLLLGAPVSLVCSWGRRRAQDLSTLDKIRLRIDTTPRADIKAQRVNRKENLKQRAWAALIAAPAGAIIGAVLTAILRD